VPTWQKSNPKHKAFNCSYAWHYRKSGLYLAIYYMIGGVTSGGKTPFFSTIENVAKYFDANYETVRRIIHQLVKEGWLKEKPDGWWWVGHKDWVKTHPNKCCVRAELVWESEADPFVGKLYAIAGGKLKLYRNNIAGIKALAEEDEILELYRREIDAASESRARGVYEGTSPKACFWAVYNLLKKLKSAREERAKAALAEALLA
jgi:hypothetical protein